LALFPSLVIPTLNDGPGMIKRKCQWIKDELGDDIPVHFAGIFMKWKFKQVFFI